MIAQEESYEEKRLRLRDLAKNILNGGKMPKCLSKDDTETVNYYLNMFKVIASREKYSNIAKNVIDGGKMPEELSGGEIEIVKEYITVFKCDVIIENAIINDTDLELPDNLSKNEESYFKYTAPIRILEMQQCTSSLSEVGNLFHHVKHANKTTMLAQMIEQGYKYKEESLKSPIDQMKVIFEYVQKKDTLSESQITALAYAIMMRDICKTLYDNKYKLQSEIQT